MRTDVHKLSLDFNNDHLKAADENEAVIFNSNGSSITASFWQMYMLCRYGGCHGEVVDGCVMMISAWLWARVLQSYTQITTSSH